MTRPQYDFSYASLPPLFPHRLKTHDVSESLLRNVRAEDKTEERWVDDTQSTSTVAATAITR